MTRSYPIPSHMEPEAALDRVIDLIAPWGYQWAEVDQSAHAVIVAAKPLVFTAIEPAIRFELHERRGCTCLPCRNLAEVMA